MQNKTCSPHAHLAASHHELRSALIPTNPKDDAMRDTVTHPITLDEIRDCLTELADEISAQNEAAMGCGDMRPVLLRKASEIIGRQAEEQRFAKYLAEDNTFWGALYRKHGVKTFDEAQRVAEEFCRKAKGERQTMVFGPKSGGKQTVLSALALAFKRYLPLSKP